MSRGKTQHGVPKVYYNNMNPDKIPFHQLRISKIKNKKPSGKLHFN